MGEREAGKETISKGELYFLFHPGQEEIFSGYGLTAKAGRKDNLVGVLMVDRPMPAAPDWLRQVEDTFGEYRLVPMTATGERGIVCRMQIEPESLAHLRQSPSEKANAIKQALEPLLEEPPNPIFALQWDPEKKLWQSRSAFPNELPEEIREVFEKVGYGCLAAETNIGVVHICHASDADIPGFANRPVLSQWQLIKMPTAPLIRLELTIIDQPDSPYRFESFLNVAEEDQARILAQLANQDRLYLAFYGDDLNYRYTKILPQERQQWQYIDELTQAAKDYLSEIPPDKRDFDRAKEEFMRLL